MAEISRPHEPLLSVRDLSVEFRTPGGPLRAVDAVSFEIFPGETLALVGESGSGKSTLARALVGLLKPHAGRIELDGAPIAGLSRAEFRPLRKKLQLVFQDPHASLNPRLSVSATLSEALMLHGHGDRRTLDARVCALLARVGLDPALRQRYPHEFSGGQRQRISVARALAVEPALLLCDEVTSALDVSVQAQLIELLRSLQTESKLSYLFITHDLGVVRSLAHRVAVMYLGRIVELQATEAFFERPQHPYSEALLASIPRLRAATHGAKPRLIGEVPSPLHPPAGCAFHPRCPRAFERCAREIPGAYAVEAAGFSRCFLRDPSNSAPG